MDYFIFLFSGWESGKQVFTFSWNETYFLAHPEGFLNQHLPLVNNLDPDHPETAQIRIDPQLVNQPFTDFTSWNNKPNMRPICWSLGIQAVNYKEGIIYTAENEVRIKLISRLAVNLWVFLKQRSKTVKTLKDYTWISNNGTDIEVCVRLPDKGIYNVEICGHPWRMEKQPDGQNNIWVKVEYTIIAEPRQRIHKFPVHTKHLGPSLHALDAGFHVIEPKQYVITAKNGRTMLVIEMPDGRVLVPLWAKLYKSDKQMSDKNLLVERHGKICVIHVICPEVGEYLLDVSLPSKPNFGCSGISFLIDCHDVKSRMPVYPAGCHNLMGPGKLMVKHGISVLYPESSTIYTKHGTATIIIQFDHPVETFFIFQDTNGNRYNHEVKEDHKGDLIHYDITPGQAGIFSFILYINTHGQHGNSAASFIIVQGDQA